jgi:hypothetical protein
MITKEPTLARVSKVGQYNFQYPNFDAPGVVIPRETPLSALSWTSAEGYRAWVWEEEQGPRVVWVEEK